MLVYLLIFSCYARILLTLADVPFSFKEACNTHEGKIISWWKYVINTNNEGNPNTPYKVVFFFVVVIVVDCMVTCISYYCK